MNIESIEDALKLLKLIKADSPDKTEESDSLVGKRVIVRSRNAGVMYGTLVSVKGQHVRLKDARNIWRWRTENLGPSLNDAAKEGLKKEYSMLSAFNERLEMLEACTIIEVSHNAAKIIDNLPDHKHDPS
jgi:hypothetical protein